VAKLRRRGFVHVHLAGSEAKDDLPVHRGKKIFRLFDSDRVRRQRRMGLRRVRSRALSLCRHCALWYPQDDICHLRSPLPFLSRHRV